MINEKTNLETIDLLAKQVSENIENLESVPKSIRYQSEFRKAVSDNLKSSLNGLKKLKEIKRDAYKGQEKEALGENQEKKEKLSGELWFGSENSDGINKFSKQIMDREKVISEIIKPVKKINTIDANKIKGTLEEKLNEAVKKSKGQTKPDVAKTEKEAKDIEEDFSRKRF